MQLRDLINSGLARRRMTVLMETVAESGKGESKSAWVWRISRLARDGIGEPNSRENVTKKKVGCLCVCIYVCVCVCVVCVLIKMHITAQPGPVKLVFKCYSNGSALWGTSVCMY